MIDLRYCPTQEMVVDVLYKGLAKDKDVAMRKIMSFECFDSSKVRV